MHNSYKLQSTLTLYKPPEKGHNLHSYNLHSLDATDMALLEFRTVNH